MTISRPRTILADDVTFSGPMGTASGADDYVASLAGFAELLDGVSVEKMLADDRDVLIWFTFTQEAVSQSPSSTGATSKTGAFSGWVTF